MKGSFLIATKDRATLGRGTKGLKFPIFGNPAGNRWFGMPGLQREPTFFSVCSLVARKLAASVTKAFVWSDEFARSQWRVKSLPPALWST